MKVLHRRHYALLAIMILITLVIALTFGSVPISWSQLYQCTFNNCANTIDAVVLWQLRLPRVIVGFLAGMGLACAGTLLQNTTRNPLADPYLFGIVAGAGLGVTIFSLALASHSNGLASIPLLQTLSIPVAAFIGSIVSVMLVFSLSKILPRTEQLLLAGVAISFLLGALSQLLLYLGEPLATNRVMFWLMGSLSRATLSHAYFIGSVVLLSYVVIAGLHRQIDSFALGDETARNLGVNPYKMKLIVLLLCAALTAVIVAYCGGIAFVGLMIPHIVRTLIGSNTLKLSIISGVIGGCFLVWVDVVARSAHPDLEIPIGIITSAIGSTFFLALLFYKRGIN